jgi:hypothetical protein
MGMHYVTRRSLQMQKHKFGVTCLGALFMKTTPTPSEHKKWHLKVSRHGRTGIHYVTHKLHRMQKHKFSVMSLYAIFVEFVLVPPEHEK